jgi:hypothetical protein
MSFKLNKFTSAIGFFHANHTGVPQIGQLCKVLGNGNSRMPIINRASYRRFDSMPVAVTTPTQSPRSSQQPDDRTERMDRGRRSRRGLRALRAIGSWLFHLPVRPCAIANHLADLHNNQPAARRHHDIAGARDPLISGLNGLLALEFHTAEQRERSSAEFR